MPDNTTNAWGPDVSHWNPVKDWSALAASGATIFGAKASDGGSYVDPTFVQHRDGFRQQPSMLLGIYFHFARMVSPASAAEQAGRFSSLVGALQPNERLCLDFEEESWGTLTPTDIRHNALRWIDDFIKALLGGACRTQRPLIYTSGRIWHAIGNPAWTLASEVDLWVKRYSVAMLPPELPYPWSNWLLWQWSDGNTPASVVPGIGPCDTSYFDGDAATLRTYLGT